METSTSYTIGSWVAITAVAALGIYYAQKRPARAPPVSQRRDSRAARAPAEPKRENKVKKQRPEAAASDAHEPAADKAAKPKSKAKPAKTENTWLSNAAGGSSDDSMDNKEFARQFATIREGIKPTAKSNADQNKQKSVKQSRAIKVADFADDGKVSAPSSTAGADADDDQSPAHSPQVGPVDAKNVSDMLEPTKTGVSSIRLVDVDKVKQPQPKKAKVEEPVETKKQRQNRQKTEQAKALREEAEKERQVKLEAQRRLARISEGRAAKDGSQFMAAVSKGSVWTGAAPNGASGKAATNAPIVPLDTYEPANSDTAGTSTSQSQNLADSWVSSLPSEEEQIEKLKEESEEWNTVAPKAAKKGPRKEGQSDKVEQTAAPVQTRPAAQIAQPAKKQQNGKTVKSTPTFGGSFSALSSKEDTLEETEWDV